jgi:hypothetical protein
MNVNIPQFWAKCKGVDKHNIVYECVVHAIRSRAGRILTFHVHMPRGAHYSLLPLTKLIWKDDAPEWDIADLQPWDCFSDHAEVICYDYLRGHRAYLIHKKVWGEYMFTVDWLDNSYSDYPPEFKQGHVVKLDNGLFGMYPNNFLLFEDKSYTGQLDVDDIPVLMRQGVEDYPSVEHHHKRGRK